MLKVLIGDILASAGDDGNVILWTQAEGSTHSTAFGEDKSDELETWRVKKMCGAMMAEIYDLAWSPDGSFFITGSMDNIARIYSSSTGKLAISLQLDYRKYISSLNRKLCSSNRRA
jgi:chromatin assembly factor 1 subunit B